MRLFNFTGLLALALTAVLILASCSDSKTSTGVSLERHHRAEGLEGLNNTVRLLTATAPAPQCGNLILEDGEQCDTADSSTCLSCNLVVAKGEVVATEYCGNGITERGEQCDDGNRANEDGCTRYCKRPICGDGYVQPSNGEVCDYKSTAHNNGLLCTESCQIPGSRRADTIDCVGSTCMVPVPKEYVSKDEANGGNAGCSDLPYKANKSVKYKASKDSTNCNSVAQGICFRSNGRMYNIPNCSAHTYAIVEARTVGLVGNDDYFAVICSSSVSYGDVGAFAIDCPGEYAELVSRCPKYLYRGANGKFQCSPSSSSSSNCDSLPSNQAGECSSASSSYSSSSSSSYSSSSSSSYSSSSSSSNSGYSDYDADGGGGATLSTSADSSSSASSSVDTE